MSPGGSGLRADLVLSGGGVLAIGHVGAANVLSEHGYAFARVAGTSAGSIVGSLIAAGARGERLREIVAGVDYPSLLDTDKLDRIPLVGPPLSVLFENGYAEGDRFHAVLEAELAALGVRTFADLRIDDDPGADPRPEHRYRLVVMAADVTRGELVRLPWDYQRYGLDPDEQLVADAVRASISVPYLFEPYKLRHAEGESLLVDGGLVSNYPLDAFDRTDGRRPRWPTIGVTLIPHLPSEDHELLPGLRLAGLIPGYRFLESLVVTATAGRDQGYLAQPWVAARSMEVDNLGVNPFDFAVTPATIAELYASGRRAAEGWLAGWSFPDYVERWRPGSADAGAG